MRRESKVAAICGAVIFMLLAMGPAQSLDGVNTVTSDDIVDGDVKAADIGAGAVQLSEIAANSVTGTRIVDGSIANSDLGTNSVGSAKVINNSLTGTDINESTLVMPGPKAHFARVYYDGSVLSGEATSVSHTQDGLYDISFPFTVTGCATTVSAAPGWGAGVVGHAGPYGAQLVRAYFNNGSNNTSANVEFSLTMICP